MHISFIHTFSLHVYSSFNVDFENQFEFVLKVFYCIQTRSTHIHGQKCNNNNHKVSLIKTKRTKMFCKIAPNVWTQICIIFLL